MREPTIVASAPKAFVEFAVAHGADRTTLLARAGIRPHDLSDPNGRIALERYVALMEAGVEMCDDPTLALKYGDQVPVEDLSIVALVAMNADSTADAGSKINRYSKLMVDDGEDDTGDAAVIVQSGGQTWIKLGSAIYAKYPILAEAGVARCVSGTRRMLKSLAAPPMHWRFPVALQFTYAEPAHRKEYDRLFGVPLIFRGTMNAIGIDPAMMSMAMPKPFNAAAGAATEAADALLAQLERPESTRSRVEQALLRAFESGDVGMDAIARRLGLSRATLYRRLKSEGSTFEDVLDCLRQKQAMRLLLDEKRSVRQTARLLGFSEPSAFSRAFRRWTGGPPSVLSASDHMESE